MTTTALPPRPHLASLVADWQRRPGERAIVEHVGVRALPTSYGALAELAGRFAAELRRRGIAPGDRVLLWGDNGAAWVAAFFGCVLCGVLVVPLDAAGSVEFAQRVTEEVRPRLMVASARLLASIRSASHRGPTVEGPDSPKLVPEELVLEELDVALPQEVDLRVDPAIGPETPLQIVFTSGTTSEPKGVVHTHRNVLASVAPIEREMARYLRYERVVHPLRFLHTLPLSHVFGQFMGLWLPPLLGAEVHFIDGVEPARLVDTIRRERVSVLVAVPRILELLRTHLLGRYAELLELLAASRGIPAWKRWWRFRRVHRLLGLKFWALICGGATLPAGLEGFWNGLGFALVQGYGMTETAALVTLNHPFKVGKGTLGKALPGREVRLSAEGEVEVRGDMLAAGTWRGGRFEPRAAEWLATGDLGQQDTTGELRFAGRKGDVIVTAAGLNVHPGDLEAALLKQPGMRACAVVGCETPRGAEPVAAVLFEGDAAALRAATEAANRGLAAFQQVSHVLRWPEPQLPYTSTGKLLRRRVEAWACTQMQPGQSGAVPMTDALVGLIAGVTQEPVAEAADDRRLTEDLHLDSLGRVQLQSELEARFGVELRDEQITQVRTLGELRALVQAPPETARPLTGTMASVDLARPAGDPAATAPLQQRREERLRYPRWPWSRPVQWLRAAFVELVARPLVMMLAKPRVVRSGSTELRGPMLVVANHVNTYDVPLVLYALPGRLRRHVAVAMSAEVLREMQQGRGPGGALLHLLGPPAAWLLTTFFNVFPLPRLQGFRRSFAHAGEALDRGYSVLLFPEGRRSYTGELAPFRPGIGLLTEAARVPVLPVALQGMGVAGETGGWFHSGKLGVVLGEPLRFAPGTPPEEITRRLEAAVRALQPS